MLADPSSFTHENLSSLKFKELQKLSVQYHVNKRWAKKQELIENLLALKDNNAYMKDTKTNDEEKQWKDGSLVFKDLTSVEHNEGVVDRRLTFNVDKKSNKDSVDPRLTFEVPQNGKKFLNQDQVIDSRQTYEVPQKKTDLGLEPLTDSRSTFDIPQKGSLITDAIDPRATFEIPQTGKKLLKEGDNSENSKKKKSGSGVKREKTNLSLIDDAKVKQKSEMKATFDIVVKDKEQKSSEKIQSQVKMLTIPYARISTRRTRKDGDGLKTENSPIKISKKSINIKKSSRLPMTKIDLIKSPGPMMKPIIKPTIPQSSTRSQITKPSLSKIPTKVAITQEKSDKETNLPKEENNDKENVKRILRKRKSETSDEVHVKKQNVKISFMTPPSVLKTHKAYMPMKKTPMRGDILTKGTPGRLNSTASHTPKTNTSVTKKSVTATKMPDFSKIHKKQFEQMDSLHDYLRKKEERRRKLFGTPQNGSQLKAVKKSSTGLFHFQSSTCEKSKEVSSNNRTPLKRKETNAKTAQKDAFKTKLPPSAMLTDIKDKNRSHIHGVRTNKRFELQMKFRNM